MYKRQLQSWYTGALVHSGRTRAITEAVAVYLVVSTVLLVIGVQLQLFTGIYYALIAFSTGGVLQTLWLWRRSRPARAAAMATAAEERLA